jgi:hypothetical protein
MFRNLSMKDLKQEMTNLHERAKAIVKALQDKISELPDNPNINRIGNSGAFSMNMSEIFKSPTMNMCPDYYDFKYQYKTLVKILEHTEPGNVFNKLEQICKDGKIDYLGKGIHGQKKNNFQFHPDVISHLKTLL